MNAVLRGELRLLPMTVAELNAVVLIEAEAYDFPWTRGNFIDSLAAGYLARLLRNNEGRVAGYFVAMKGVEEMHLLNLTVASAEQGRGHARCMLDELAALCTTMHARQLYLRYGFRHVGVRRGYYPALQNRREDAAVMSLDVNGGLP